MVYRRHFRVHGWTENMCYRSPDLIVSCIITMLLSINFLVKKLSNKWKNMDPNFLFFYVKASKYITHIKRLKDCKQAWKVFWNRI